MPMSTLTTAKKITRQMNIPLLPEGLAEFSRRIEEHTAPSAVLDELHTMTTRSLPLCVLGAARFPLKSGDWDAVQLGRSIFLHKNSPDGWWEEYETVARGRFRPLLFLARHSLA